ASRLLSAKNIGGLAVNILLSIIYLALGFTIGIFLYAQMLLPLIYGLPRSLYLFFNGELRFMGVVSQIITPVFWFVFLIVLGFLFEWPIPSLNRFLTTNAAFGLGNLLAIGALLLNFFTSKGRADMRDDFLKTTYSRFKIG